MIRLDRSASTVLAVCECGWRSLAGTDLAAWDAGRTHERQCHPGQQAAARAYDQTRRRATVRRL